jgi:hypothetical protein
MQELCLLAPIGLTRQQCQRLAEYVEHAAQWPIQQLLAAAQAHLHETFIAHQRNPLVNLRLAEAIWQTIRQVASQWNTLSPEARSWLAGAILYFAKSDDEEPDLTSPIGFEDDAEVLNTCLRLAHCEDLSLNPEDYDDV